MLEISPSLVAAPYDVVSKSASEFGAMADYGSKVYSLIQKAEDHTTYLKAENLINGDIEKELDKFKYRIDHDKFSKDAEDIKNTLKQKYQTAYENNPKVWSSVDTYLGKELNNFQKSVDAIRLKRLNEDENLQLNINTEELAQQYIKAGTSEQKEIVGNDFKIKIVDALRNKLITGDDAEKRLKEFPKKCEEAELITAVKGDDPLLIARTLGKLDAGGFKHLDIKQQAIYKEALEQREEKVKDKIEKKNTELSVNASLGKLEQKWQHPDGSFDFASAEKELNNPDFRKENGLLDVNGNPNRKAINEVETYLHAKRADTENIRKEGVEKEKEKAINLIVGGKYGEASKLIKQSKFLKNEPEGLTLLNAIRTWSKRTDDDISSHEDRSEYVRLNKMIDDGTDPSEVQKEIVKSGHIKSGTAFKLLDRLDKNLETDVRHGITTSNHLLQGLVAPTKGLGEPVIPEEVKRVADAQQDLQTWALAEKKKATDGKRPPLTTKEIVDHAKEIAPQYMMTVDQRMKALKEYMKPSKDKKYSQEDLEYTAKQHNISVDEVKKRLGVK